MKKILLFAFISVIIVSCNKYEKSIDEVIRLGAKKVVLTGFGEPMLDKNLELKIK